MKCNTIITGNNNNVNNKGERMKNLLVVAILGVLMSCESNNARLYDDARAQGCEVTETDFGAIVECEGEEAKIYNGEDGLDGLNGLNGEDGLNGTNGLNGAKGDKGDTGATGAKGMTGATGTKGDKGDTGSNGSNGQDGKDGVGCKAKAVAGGVELTCSNGTFLVANGDDGKDGADGADGQDGKDGKDAAILSIVKVEANSCTQVAKDLWVQNINSGEVFDVYYNEHCADAQGEFCDNLSPSYAEHNNGQVIHDSVKGSGTTCWAKSRQITGHKDHEDDTYIMVHILDFN